MPEMTNAERNERIAQSKRKTGSAVLPLRAGQKTANGRIRQKRTAQYPQRFRAEIPDCSGCRIAEMVIAAAAGPNAPITPMSIRYVKFFTPATAERVQMIHEMENARIKNAVIG
jgi:hypothetical protein